MKINFSVKQKDIDDGLVGKCNHCPVALSARRRLKRFLTIIGVFVGPEEMIVTYSTDAYPYERLSLVLPFSVSRFIGDFDRGREVKPFRFSLDFGSVFA